MAAALARHESALSSTAEAVVALRAAEPAASSSCPDAELVSYLLASTAVAPRAFWKFELGVIVRVICL